MSTKRKMTPFLIIVSGLIGSLLGSILVYIAKGEFPYGVLLGALAGTLILIALQVVKIKRKNNSLPETDERVSNNVFRFFAYISHTTLAVLCIGLAIITLLGNETVPTIYLWGFFFIYLLLAGMGGFIVKRK